jgi:hypothetical protein
MSVVTISLSCNAFVIIISLHFYECCDAPEDS